MENYFIGLDKMTLDELEIWRLLCRYSNYKTDVAGYTVNQLVIAADTRLNLTTQRVRTILKGFEKQGYIQFLTTGSKGKESTLKLTIKQQLFNNNVTNKSECLQGVEELPNNNVTTIQQLSNNTTKRKEKENNIKKEKVTNFDMTIEAYTQNIDLVEAIKDFIKMRKTIKKPMTDRALKGILNKLDLYSTSEEEKILILENSIENCWQTVYELKNKKAPVGAGTEANKKYNYNPSICSKQDKYTQGVKMV